MAHDNRMYVGGISAWGVLSSVQERRVAGRASFPKVTTNHGGKAPGDPPEGFPSHGRECR